MVSWPIPLYHESSAYTISFSLFFNASSGFGFLQNRFRWDSDQAAKYELILVFGTIWPGNRARNDTEKAARSVSLLYLDELAGRREQVVADNLQEKITVIGTALELMTEDDLSDLAHLQVYQAKMKRLFVLDKFAFWMRTG